MPRAFDPRDPESYLADPRTRKWVGRCLSCWRFGYRADGAERFFNRHRLEKESQPLDLDEMGRCQWCRAAVESGGPVPFGYVYGPREPESDERESYEELEGRWRAEERLGSHATIKRCEAKWEWLVQQIEVGYDALLEEWQNDLDARLIIQRAIDQLPESPFPAACRAVRPWDERFQVATRPASRRYWTGGCGPSGYPSSLEPS